MATLDDLQAQIERLLLEFGNASDALEFENARRARLNAQFDRYTRETRKLEEDNLRAELARRNRLDQIRAAQSWIPQGPPALRQMRADGDRVRPETDTERMARRFGARSRQAIFGKKDHTVGQGVKAASNRMLGGMSPLSGGGMLGVLMQAIGDNAKIRAETNRLMNVMNSVDAVDQKLFGNMKQRYMALKTIGAEGDLMAVQSAFAKGAIGDESLKTLTDMEARGPGGGRDVSAISMAMDNLGGMGAGTTATAISEVMKSSSSGIKETTEALAKLQLRTRGTGVSFGQLLQTMTQITGALKLQAGDVGVLGTAYETARASFGRLFGGINESNKRMLSQAAMRGTASALGAGARASDGMSILMARSLRDNPELAAKLGVDLEGQSDLGMLGSMKLGTMYKGFGREAQAAVNTGLLVRQYGGMLSQYDTTEEKVAALTQTDEFRGDSEGAMAALSISEALERFEQTGDRSELKKVVEKNQDALMTAQERRAKEQNQLLRAQLKIQQGIMEIALSTLGFIRSGFEFLGAGIMELVDLTNPFDGDSYDFGRGLKIASDMQAGAVSGFKRGVGKSASAAKIAGKEFIDMMGGTQTFLDARQNLPALDHLNMPTADEYDISPAQFKKTMSAAEKMVSGGTRESAAARWVHEQLGAAEALRKPVEVSMNNGRQKLVLDVKARVEDTGQRGKRQ